MTDLDFQNLLNKAVKAAIDHNECMRLVGIECQRRYGFHYSDVDVDVLIDTVNLGNCYTDVKTVNEAFELALKIKGLKKEDGEDMF